jgi:xyloglucan-specific exo-beta-1,4-glucanase
MSSQSSRLWRVTTGSTTTQQFCLVSITMRIFYALPMLLAATPIEAAFSWTSVHTGGGGGFIPSIVFHPNTKGVAYARTDIGGMYKLNSDDSWTPISDGIAQDASWYENSSSEKRHPPLKASRHNWGTDALAIDPQNADVVYAALGMYTNSWYAWFLYVLLKQIDKKA